MTLLRCRMQKSSLYDNSSSVGHIIFECCCEKVVFPHSYVPFKILLKTKFTALDVYEKQSFYTLQIHICKRLRLNVLFERSPDYTQSCCLIYLLLILSWWKIEIICKLGAGEMPNSLARLRPWHNSVCENAFAFFYWRKKICNKSLPNA